MAQTQAIEAIKPAETGFSLDNLHRIRAWFESVGHPRLTQSDNLGIRASYPLRPTLRSLFAD